MMEFTRATIAVILLAAVASAFSPPQPISRSAAVSSPLFSTSTALDAVPNPFRQLPWNVEKEKQRKSRKLRFERSKLHRELGIAEDASYEEIVAATDSLIATAGEDLKRKIKIEVAKDKILQIRLNERLAGLAASSADARAQSSFEVDGNEVDESTKKKDDSEWQPPRWTQGLIVKPDEKQIKSQARLWGGLTFAGLAFPPAIDYLNRFTWLVCIAQLSFRGMPRDNMGGGLGISFDSGPGGKSHLKVAWLLGVTVSILGATIVYGLMPAWAKGGRYTALLAFTMRNTIYGVACSYLQTYKG